MCKICCLTCINNQAILSHNNKKIPYCCEHSFLIPDVNSICCNRYVESKIVNKRVTYYYDPVADKIVFEKDTSTDIYNNWLGEK
jgi:hypothetical protein